MNKTIKTGCHGVIVTLDPDGNGGAISSDLHAMFHDPELGEGQDDIADAAADALESFILALACEKVDIESPAFLCALETAVDAIANNLPEQDQTYEVNKELVVSTAHISEETNTALIDPDGSLRDILATYDYEYGYRFFIGNEDDKLKTNFPGLDALMKIARKQGCKWLVLDQDGPVYDWLEKFDW